MPTRLLLEGKDLSELMVHVRAEFGPHARIVRAERVRSGGVAGFFAKESYELTVDVPEAPPEPTSRPWARRQAISNLESLLAAADAADGHAKAGAAAVPAQRGAAEQTTATAEQEPTDGETFAAILAKVRGPEADAAADAAPVLPAAAADALDRVFSLTSPEQATAATPPLEQPAAAVTAGTTSPAPIVPVRTRGIAPAGPPTIGDLRALGLPESLLAGAPAHGDVRLSAVLSSLPEPADLPREPGTVLAIVGRGRDVLRVAGQVAERLGLDDRDVVHVGTGMPGVPSINSVPGITRWRTTAHQDRVNVVVLSVGDDTASRMEAARRLSAIRPDAVWGVIDARSKSSDLRRWLAEVGVERPVDTVAVHGLFDTSEPGTVLNLGLPVAWVDGVPATRVAWAAALSRHLTGAVWD